MSQALTSSSTKKAIIISKLALCRMWTLNGNSEARLMDTYMQLAFWPAPCLLVTQQPRQWMLPSYEPSSVPFLAQKSSCQMSLRADDHLAGQLQS